MLAGMDSYPCTRRPSPGRQPYAEPAGRVSDQRKWKIRLDLPDWLIVCGGVAANGIAVHAEMKGDFRDKSVASSPKILKALDEICGKTYVPRTETTLYCDPNHGFIPMEKTDTNAALYNIVKEQGTKIGVDIEGITVGAGQAPGDVHPGDLIPSGGSFPFPAALPRRGPKPG